jgi:hypothetical protein
MNQGDTKSAIATFTDESSIIDDLAPHYWHGKGAPGQWLAAAGAASSTTGMTNFVSTLGKPSRILIDGESAYAVLPLSYTYRSKGATRHGSTIMTVALQQQSGAWRIAAIAFVAK